MVGKIKAIDDISWGEYKKLAGHTSLVRETERILKEQKEEDKKQKTDLLHK